MSLSDAHTLEPNTVSAESPAAIAARLAARFAETAAATSPGARRRPSATCCARAVS